VAESTRVQLILEWAERHPEVVRGVQDKLASLRGQYMNVCKWLRETFKEEGKLNRALNVARAVYKERMANLVQSTESARMFGEVLERLSLAEKEEQAVKEKAIPIERKALEAAEEGEKRRREEQKKGESALKKFGDALARVGWRLGWFAYRTLMVGRMLMRWLTKPITQGIRTLVNWESAVDRAATAMGLLAVAGYTSAEQTAFLTETMSKLIQVGMKVQGAFLYLQTVFAAIVADLGEPLANAFFQIAEAIRATWEEVGPRLVPAIQELIDSILPPLIDLIREVGPALAEGIIQGLQITIPLLLDLISAFQPLAPIIGNLIGILLPFGPILMAVGTAAYVVGTFFSGLGEIISFVGGIAGAFGISLSGLLPILGIVAAAVAAGILIWQHWGEICQWFSGVVDALRPILEPLWDLLVKIGDVVYQCGRVFYEAGRVVAGVFYVGLQKLWDLISPYILPVLETLWNAMKGIGETIWNTLGPAIKWLTDALDGLSNVLGGVADWLGGLADALFSLCFKHAAPQAEQFNRVLSDTLTLTSKVQRSVEGLGGSLRGIEGVGFGGFGLHGIGAGSIVQHISVSATIEVGSISGEVDLDRVTDAVNRGIAEALRRRL